MKTIPLRTEISPEKKWNLGHIFANTQRWEQNFTRAKEAVAALSALPGTLSVSAAGLLKGLDQLHEASELCEKLYVYAHMLRDEDNSDSTAQALADRSETLMVELGAASAFCNPEILTIIPETLALWQNSESGLDKYRQTLREVAAQREHTLTPPEEKLLAQTHEMAAVPKTAFTLLETLDLDFPSIEVEGEQIQLSHARYAQLLENSDRAVRQNAYETYYATFARHRNTIAALYAGSVKNDCFYAKARRHTSALAASLHHDLVPETVYNSLISAVEQALPAMHRYIALKGRVLGVEPRMFDLYVPLCQDYGPITYEEARELVQAACQPLGSDYNTVLKSAFDQGWIDVEETKNKTTGAYSWGCYSSHPYVLLNHRDQLDSAFTLAHEMGHAMHSFLAHSNNPYPCAHYRILVAEVASIVNELLLLNYLIDSSTKKEQKAYLLNHFCDSVRSTVYRQTMFASFEKQTHAQAEAGEALTHDWLCETYAALNAKFQGFASDHQIALEWARIPHFYNAFYVYKYATGFSAAAAIVEAIRAEGEPAVERYLNFLSVGGSMDALESLKIAGVDLTSPEPVARCLGAFGEKLGALEGMV
ncbi:MAG: oligoendopeptidase F [Clostridia bacterium]|nr:oligoendopeptidase F [Clostridia bacterium]